VNLALRGVIFHGGLPSCALCEGGLESEDHFFLWCSFAWSIWSEVYRWFDVVEVMCSFASHFECFLASIERGKDIHKGALLV
jgi:hypothetical protein